MAVHFGKTDTFLGNRVTYTQAFDTSDMQHGGKMDPVTETAFISDFNPASMALQTNIFFPVDTRESLRISTKQTLNRFFVSTLKNMLWSDDIFGNVHVFTFLSSMVR